MLLRMFIPTLAEPLRKRSTSVLFRLLRDQQNQWIIRNAPAHSPAFKELVIMVAEAVELGYPDPRLLEELVIKLPHKPANRFAACVAKGVLAARKGQPGAAKFFQRSLADKSFQSKEHIAFVRACLSNVLRKQGKYEEDDGENERGRRRAAAGHPVCLV